MDTSHTANIINSLKNKYPPRAAGNLTTFEKWSLKQQKNSIDKGGSDHAVADALVPATTPIVGA